MDTTASGSLIRLVSASTTRRSTLRRLIAGTAVTAASGGLLRVNDASSRKKKRKSRKKMQTQNDTPPPVTENVCGGKNWCVDRTQTCGPSGGYGKCLVESTGGNICAEILFQVPSCSDCGSPNCTNCRCVLAAGGGDRCNNGANGYEFICVREILGA